MRTPKDRRRPHASPGGQTRRRCPRARSLRPVVHPVASWRPLQVAAEPERGRGSAAGRVAARHPGFRSRARARGRRSGSRSPVLPQIRVARSIRPRIPHTRQHRTFLMCGRSDRVRRVGSDQSAVTCKPGRAGHSRPVRRHSRIAPGSSRVSPRSNRGYLRSSRYVRIHVAPVVATEEAPTVIEAVAGSFLAIRDQLASRGERARAEDHPEA